MIQTLSILALLLAIALVVLDFVVLRPRRSATAPTAAMRKIEWLIYVAFLIALAGMVLSGIVPLAFGERMHHWMLILHMTLAPLFSICIAALAVMWSGQLPIARPDGAVRSCACERIAFCLVIASSFVAITSAMLGMMSWFGSEWQECLLNLHRGAALVLLIAAAYQAARLLPRREKKTWSVY